MLPDRLHDPRPIVGVRTEHGGRRHTGSKQLLLRQHLVRGDAERARRAPRERHAERLEQRGHDMDQLPAAIDRFDEIHDQAGLLRREQRFEARQIESDGLDARVVTQIA